MKNIFQSLTDKLHSWWEGFILMLPNLAVAIVIFVGFIFIARYSKKFLNKLLNKVSDNKAVNRLLANVITVVVVLIGLFIALGILDLSKTVTSLLAGAGVVGLAIGLAFQDPILNVISGVILSVKRVPFKIGDLVRTNGHYGFVERISLRTTIIKSLSGEDVILPNKIVVQNSIVNYSFSAERRVDIDCGVAYDSDLQMVQETALSAIESNIERLEERPIEFMYTEFGDSSINFTLRYWIKETGEKDFLNSRSKGIMEIKKAFDSKGITIPFPIRTLEFSQDDVASGIVGKGNA
ncbi:MAG: mechanosensitive ion channel [bacterium]|nr:mechanosensitive ion channel [bacterium]